MEICPGVFIMKAFSVIEWKLVFSQKKKKKKSTKYFMKIVERIFSLSLFFPFDSYIFV